MYQWENSALIKFRVESRVVRKWKYLMLLFVTNRVHIETINHVDSYAFHWLEHESIILGLLHRASLQLLKNNRRICCHLLIYFTSYVFNMFRILIYPSSGACDCVVELSRLSFCSVKTEDLALV